jgi:glycosyltransferase involved in cell wall biosynthesis
MRDKLLVIFVNYNGHRTCNDLSTPRIKVTIDSFRKTVPNYDDLNVLLLDVGSTDRSQETLKQYQRKKWIYKTMPNSGYYLGTLRNLLRAYRKKYKYFLMPDNDHFFYNKGFLDPCLSTMESRSEFISTVLWQTTMFDMIDGARKRRFITKSFIAGVFDDVFVNEDRLWLRAINGRNIKKNKWFKPVSKKRGSGVLHFGRNKQRICWMWYSYGNTLFRTDKVYDIFKHKTLRPPFGRTDRLALFSSYIGRSGRILYLAGGASINIGYRKYLRRNYSVKNLVEHFKLGVRSSFITDEFGRFFNGKKLESIENVVQKKYPKYWPNNLTHCKDVVSMHCNKICSGNQLHTAGCSCAEKEERRRRKARKH